MTGMRVGPTGKYPNGKLEPSDDGELKLAIGTMDGLVMVEFGTPVAWLAMSPNDARRLADSLTQMAARVEDEQS